MGSTNILLEKIVEWVEKISEVQVGRDRIRRVSLVQTTEYLAGFMIAKKCGNINTAKLTDLQTRLSDGFGKFFCPYEIDRACNHRQKRFAIISLTHTTQFSKGFPGTVYNGTYLSGNITFPASEPR